MTAPRRWLVSLTFPSWMFLSILSVLHLVPLPVTLAAHARKRPTVASASQRRSANNPYDKQITTFDTDGHIMQLQYAQKAVSKGSSALFIHYKDQIIVVLQTTNHDKSPQNKSDYKNKSLYRLHHGMFAKMTGLQGDSRLLAKYLMQKSLEFDWKEGQLNSNQPLLSLTSLRIQQIANACAEVQHSLTTKPGARPLAVDAVLFGIDGVVDMRETKESASATGSDNDIDSDSIHQMTYRHKLGLYKCHLTGVVDQCQFCVVGNIASNRMLYDECKQQMEDLLLHVSTKENEDEIASTIEADADADAHRLLIINSMAKLLLKHQLQRQELIDDISGTPRKGKDGDDNKSNLSITDDAQSKDSPAVDIYILTPDPKCRGGIKITCATCVKENDIERVGQLLQSTSQR